MRMSFAVDIYRLRNNRYAQNDSNRRFTAHPTIYQSLQAQGGSAKASGSAFSSIR